MAMIKYYMKTDLRSRNIFLYNISFVKNNNKKFHKRFKLEFKLFKWKLYINQFHNQIMINGFNKFNKLYCVFLLQGILHKSYRRL